MAVGEQETLTQTKFRGLQRTQQANVTAAKHDPPRLRQEDHK